MFPPAVQPEIVADVENDLRAIMSRGSARDVDIHQPTCTHQNSDCPLCAGDTQMCRFERQETTDHASLIHLTGCSLTSRIPLFSLPCLLPTPPPHHHSSLLLPLSPCICAFPPREHIWKWPWTTKWRMSWTQMSLLSNALAPPLPAVNPPRSLRGTEATVAEAGFLQAEEAAAARVVAAAGALAGAVLMAVVWAEAGALVGAEAGAGGVGQLLGEFMNKRGERQILSHLLRC